MVSSEAKMEVIRRHQGNELLQAPYLSPMQRSEKDLSVDQPTMGLRPAMIQGAMEALEAGQTHYVAVPGVDPLREALAHYINGPNVTGYSQENVLVTAGMDEARFLSIQKVGELFGCIAMPEVVHPGARKAAGVRQLDVRFLPVDGENGMLPTLAGMEEALGEGCKLLYLESPVRCTGAVFNPCTIEAIADLVESFGGAVIWDQGLRPWATEECVSLASLPGMAQWTVAIGEAWPGAGLEGLRIGYVAAKEEWREPMQSQKQIQSICTSTPSQFAALKAADMYDELRDEQFKALSQRRDEALRIVESLNAEVVPGAATNLIAVKVTDAARAAALLRQHGFHVAAGDVFGAPNLVRLSVARGEALSEALEQLAAMDEEQN